MIITRYLMYCIVIFVIWYMYIVYVVKGVLLQVLKYM